MRAEKKDKNNTWNIADILQLESLKRDFPVLKRKEDVKELAKFKRANAEVFKDIARTQKELKSHLKKLELPDPGDLTEIKHFRNTRNPEQVLSLFKSEIKWLENKKTDWTYWAKPGSLNQKINKDRYKGDPLKLDYLLFTKERRGDVIKWWNLLFSLAEALTRDPFKSQLEALRARHKELIDKIGKQSLDKSTRRGRKNKSDRLKVSTEKKYLQRALKTFIGANYPNNIIKQKADYRLKSNNPIYSDFLTKILKGFSDQNKNYFSDQEIKQIAIKKPTTLSGLTNICIEIKRHISERTRKDYIKDWTG